MSEVIPTTERVFMSVVGPVGSGQTTSLRKISTLPIFQSRCQSILFFCQQYQPAYDKLNIAVEKDTKFMQGLDFERILSIATADQKRRFLILDNVSEELLKSQDFAKIANAGGHK